MAFVRTLLGDISPEDLGYTYSHEHIICRPAYWLERGTMDLILDSVEKSTQDVLLFKSMGGKTIVDATAIDYGRDVEEVAEISKDTGVQVVGTAGFNKGFLWDSKLTPRLKELLGDYDTYLQWIEESTIDTLTEHVVKEVTHGLEGTEYKAGQVKLGTGYNSIIPLEEKTIRAVARAQKLTNAPLHCHTEAGTMALEQIKLLTQEGICMEHVSFGHMDRNLDIYYYKEILKTGAYLCFDGMGKIKYAPESHRIESIIKLCMAGYADKILISGDMARRSYYNSYGYGPGLGFIIGKWSDRFINEATEAGLDGKDLLKKFFIENPKKAFAFKG